MNKDASILQQPEGTYRGAYNFVQISKHGNLFALTNEQGTIERTTTFPDDFQVMGYTVLDTEIFVALATATGYSQVGYIQYDGTYVRSCPSSAETDALANVNSELGLTIDRPVDMASRKRLAGDRYVYWCNGTGGVPLSFLNANDVPVIGEITDNTKVIPNQRMPAIDLQEIQEISGNLNVGVYHFMTRYYTADLTPTTYSVPSGIIPIVNDYTTVGRDKFDGEYPDVGSVNKAISIDITNIDTSFPFIEIIVIRYQGITSTFTAEAMELKNITGTDMTILYSGNEINVTSVTKEELNISPISYSSAKAVIQKDNRLFWSNLADNSNQFDLILQAFANDITFEYTIKEIEYRPSNNELTVGGIASLDFGLAVLPYLDTSEVPPLTLYMQFNGSVNTSASALSDFTLTSAELSAKGSIQIIGPALMFNVVGDTIGVADGVGVPETFTAVESATPSAFEFDVTSQDATTIAANLALAITTDSLLLTGTASTDTVSIESVATGTASNNTVITYTDLSGTGTSVTLYDYSGTPGNPLNLSGGQDGVSYTPISYQYLDPEDLSLVTLIFDVADLPDGISAGSTVTYTVVDGTSGAAFSESNIDVVNGAGAISDPTSLGQFTDYKSEFQTFYSKGYQRNEVYALGVTGIYEDGSQTANYPISGNDKLTTTTTVALPYTPGVHDADSKGLLGTYVSANFDNPSNQFYPGTSTGDDTSVYSIDSVTAVGSVVTPVDRQTRHFKMPSLEQEPHFRLDGTTGVTYIRVLGLKATYNSKMPDVLINNLQSVMITRQKRDNSEKRSIFSQGLVNRYCQIDRSYNYDNTDGSSPAWKKLPFLNNTNIEVENAVLSGAQIPFPSIAFQVDVTDTPTGDTRDNSLSLEPINERMAFMSPEAQFNFLNPNNAQGTFLTPVLGMQAITKNNFKSSKQISESFLIYETSKLKNFLQCWTHFDFTTTFGPGIQTTSLVEEAQYIPRGQEVSILGMANPIDNKFSSRHLYLKVDGTIAPNFGLSDPQTLTFKGDFRHKSNFLTDPSVDVQNDDTYNQGTTITNNLFNLQSINAGQYGDLSGGVYIPVEVAAVPTVAGASLDSIFNGDIFISKFAYRNYDIYEYRGGYHNDSNVNDFTKWLNDGTDYYNSAFLPDTAQGMDLKSVVYFFVESQVNCNYRHQYIDRGDPLAPVAEATYFPNETLSEVWKTFCTSGDSTGYNFQYSFENDVRTYANKLAAQTNVGAFPNRTIYSNKSIEDEISDGYRLYQQNSYYDLPKHTGEIWDNFVYNNTLYLHTPKSLWRAFVNDVTQQATSAGEVVMGTGGLFSMPAKEMIVSTGGYAGSSSQWAGIITPYAYFFPDVLQGKIFMLQGDQLRDISQSGLQQYFLNNLAEGVIDATTGVVADNPFTGTGLLGGYDFAKKRYIFSKTGTTNDFTISYSSLSESWISLHNYQPNVLITSNNDLYAIVNDPTITKMHEHNVGPYGQFYGAPPVTSTLDVVFNKAAAQNKTWDNMVHYTISRDASDVVQQFDCWTRMRVYSTTRNTGWYDMIVTNAYGSKAVDDPNTQVRVRRNNDKFNLTIPADVVVDDAVSIFDITNQDPTATFKPRMKGNQVIANFVYDNANNYEFIVNFISATFRPNAS